MRLEEHAASPLAGGISQHGYQCGLVWGAALAAGAHAYRLYGPGPEAESAAVHASQEVVDAFRDRTGYVDCFDVTSNDWKNSTTSAMLKFFLKGGPVKCFTLTSGFSRQALDAIEDAMSDEPADVPEAPVSCAAEMARKLGASDLQATMAAGFAGGIGLCGGACGALGAAVWMFGVNSGAEDLAYGMSDPRVEAIVERYLESADYTFECAEVTGRRFESVADHAAYLREGGCANIIEALAEQAPAE